MPVSKYFEADVTILGFHVPSVGFLVVKDPNTVLEPQYSTQTPGVIGYVIWSGLGVRSSGRCLDLRLLKPSHALKRSILWSLLRCVPCTIRVRFKFNLFFMLIHPIVHNPIHVHDPTSQVTIFILHKKTLVLQMQFSVRYGLAAHTRIFAFWPIQWKLFKARLPSLPDDFPAWLRQGHKIIFQWGSWLIWTAVTPTKSKRVPVTLLNTNSYNVWIRQPVISSWHCRGGSLPMGLPFHHVPWWQWSPGFFLPCAYCQMYRQMYFLSVLPKQNYNLKLVKWLQLKEENKGKGLNLGLDLSLTPRLLTLNRNWHDFLSQLTSGKWSCHCHNRNVSWSLFMIIRAFSHYAMRISGLCDWLKHTIPTTTTQTRLLATSYYSSSVANWGLQMSGYLAQTRNYTSISQPVCIASGYSS